MPITSAVMIPVRIMCFEWTRRPPSDLISTCMLSTLRISCGFSTDGTSLSIRAMNKIPPKKAMAVAILPQYIP